MPIVMITAYGDPETKRKALEGGASGLLTKPIDFALLREKIDARLGQAGFWPRHAVLRPMFRRQAAQIAFGGSAPPLRLVETFVPCFGSRRGSIALEKHPAALDGVKVREKAARRESTRAPRG